LVNRSNRSAITKSGKRSKKIKRNSYRKTKHIILFFQTNSKF
jgi:hypothetical protein